VSDVAAAAAQAGRPAPVVVERSVDGATNQYEGGTPRDEEIALDIQVVAGIVPGARIVVYFAQNTTASLAAAIHQAVFDDVNRPQVLSISWGSAEKFWQPGPRAAVQAALADAVRLKVSVTVASGDLLATGGVSDGAAHVFFPSSSPYVLGCGGTALTLQGNDIVSEAVWKENFTGTGGGISEVFPVPDFQAHAALPPSVTTGARGRGVPDVAAAAASVPGYRIILDGNAIVKDGTSAVAPLWAAMIALANARRGAPLGLVNPILYGNPNLFRPITEGDNRFRGVGYDAAPGRTWNACTGLGAPKGAEVIAALAAAGTAVV
jgi:kumamolisin